jgi:hypothetical protein
VARPSSADRSLLLSTASTFSAASSAGGTGASPQPRVSHSVLCICFFVRAHLCSSPTELHLRTLQRERQAKIDEIKRATKYDSLRLLLEKYDDSPEARKGRMAAVGAQTPQTKAQLLQQQKAAAAAKSPNSKQGAEFQGKGAQAAAQQAQRGALAAGAPGASPVAAQLAAQAMPRTWLDRVADAVLGADGEANKVTPDEQKYALICRECRSHNGLCHKSEWDEVRELRPSALYTLGFAPCALTDAPRLAEYICPKCGAFNSRRPSSAPISSPWASTTQRRQGSAASTPASPLASSRIGAHAPQGEEMRELRGAQTAEEKQGQEAQRETDTEEDNAPPTMPLRAGASPAGSQEGSPKRKGLRARRSAAADSAEAMEMD